MCVPGPPPWRSGAIWSHRFLLAYLSTKYMHSCTLRELVHYPFNVPVSAWVRPALALFASSAIHLPLLRLSHTNTSRTNRPKLLLLDCHRDRILFFSSLHPVAKVDDVFRLKKKNTKISPSFSFPNLSKEPVSPSTLAI